MGAQAQGLTREYLKSILHYDADTGILTWRERSVEYFKSERDWKTWTTRFASKEAGSVVTHPRGGRYRQVSIKGKRYLAHRIIFYMVHGYLPDILDHIDQDGRNNRIENLREASYEINARNARMKSNNTSGFPGVSWSKYHAKWAAEMRVSGKTRFLGYYDNPEEAGAVYRKAILEDGYSPNHGSPRRTRGTHG